MAMQKYEIFYSGLKFGVSEQEATEQISQLLNVEHEAALKIVRNVGVPLSSGLTREQSSQYLNAFNDAGLQVEIRDCKVQRDGFSDKPPTDSANYSHTDNSNGSDSSIVFKGKGFEYFKIWIVNIFLTIITLGIYSAWAKVRNKQYFYGNTFVDNTSFRYTAKPLAILKGRLIAVGFFAVYSVINHYNQAAGAIIFLMLLAFIPWVVIRSLQFNARNSVFRNVRFDFKAKTKDALIVFLLWPILIPFTLGLIAPYIWYKQSQFFINHSAYGTSSFEFSASAKDYYKIFLKILLVIIGFSIVSGVLINSMNLGSPEEFESIMPLISPLIMLIYLFIFAYSAAALGNLYFNATTIRSHGFTSQLQTPQMAWLYFSNTLGIVLTLGLFIPWAQVRIARYRSDCLSLDMDGSLDNFVNDEQQKVSALGEQVGEVFDMDVSVL